MFKKLLASLLILTLLIVGGSAGYFLHWKGVPSKTLAEQTVLIPAGTGVRGIIAKLQEAQLVNQPYLFKALVMLEKKQAQLKAGEYIFEAGLSPTEILQKLTKGDVINHRITIPEGWTSAEILARLNADDRLTGTLPETLAEGEVLPETYQFLRGEERAALLGRMRRDMRTALDALWEKRQENLPVTTKKEALTLASIVEKETGVDGERGLVASVFTNRLRIGMPLQSDPTVIYAVEQARGKPLDRALYTKDLKIDNPYNTYKYTGLPPGPIATPGLEAIKAVLNPPTSDYLYFVATGTGGHNFSKNLAEHNRNVRLYRAELRKQGLR